MLTFVGYACMLGRTYLKPKSYACSHVLVRGILKPAVRLRKRMSNRGRTS